jgi:hypothetical protein
MISTADPTLDLDLNCRSQIEIQLANLILQHPNSVLSIENKSSLQKTHF